MPLSPGRRLGPYEIVSPIGAGGMGEVYQARDTRLGRTVAIKVLPEGLAEDPERRARFEREARTVSRLSHPHVCTLHDVGEEEGIHYLVLEHCEGETLAGRLERGALPLEETLRFGAQIAEALAAAHRREVVHRDLKPANVMLTPSGVKLLDFGLARLAAREGEAPGNLPTRTLGTEPLTDEGTLLGTYPYMAPEQVEGAEADARSDLFALGAVLYEMATGRRAFDGESAASVMASVLKEEPEPLSKLQPVAPPVLDHVVSRCLAKDPERRWQTARDVAEELRWIAEAGSQAGVAAPVAKRRKSRERWAWGLAAALALVLAAVVGSGLGPRGPEEVAPALRFTLPPPDATAYDSIPAVSPDGRLLAFVADEDEGPARLWIRPLSSVRAQALAGTEGAEAPFWSPDGRSLAFFTDNTLKRIDLGTGAVRSLTRADIAWGGSWSPRGAILFVDEKRGLLRVPESGGPPTDVTVFAEAKDRLYFWPHFLPDGERFLFSSWGPQGGGLYLASLEGGEARLLREMPSVLELSRAEYDPAGYVLFVSREGGGSRLLAQRLELEREELVGDPFQVAEEVFVSGPGAARFAVGPRGLLVLRESASQVLGRLHWVSGEGDVVGAVGPEEAWGPFDLDPEGSTVAFTRGSNEVWLLDVDRGTPTRLTEGYQPVWSPDGRRLALSSGGPPNPFVADVVAGGEPRRVASFSKVANPTDWTPDGENLVVQTPEASGSGLYLVPTDGGDVEPLGRPGIGAPAGRLSPDGRWLAYVSEETGDRQVYVTGFPGPGRRWRVSGDGGSDSRWAPDGKALLYGHDGQILQVPVEGAGGGLRLGDPRVLFEHEDLGPWDVAPGGRLLVALATGERVRPPLLVLSEWRFAAGLTGPEKGV